MDIRRLGIWVTPSYCPIDTFANRLCPELTTEDVAQLDAAGSQKINCAVMLFQRSPVATLLGVLFVLMVIYGAGHYCYPPGATTVSRFME